MKNKLNVKDIISKMKVGLKKENSPINNVLSKPSHRERDMRQESIDMGSHNAQEYFRDSKV